MAKGEAGTSPKLPRGGGRRGNGTERINLVSFRERGAVSPVLVELDGKVGEGSQCFVGERHVSVDHSTATTECTGDFKTFAAIGWKPHLHVHRH